MSGVLQPYEYVVVRLTPDPVRGERVNLAVVLYSQAHDVVLCAARRDPARWRALCAHVDVDAVAAAVTALEHSCARRDEPARVRFGRLAAPRSTIVAPGPVHAGLTADPAPTLARLRARLLD